MKGTTINKWKLCHASDADYKKAFKTWSDKHRKLIFCFVQFENITLGQMPKIYLVSGDELILHQETGFFGDVGLELIEFYAPTKGTHAGKTQSIPEHWLISQKRIDDLFQEVCPMCEIRPSTTHITTHDTWAMKDSTHFLCKLCADERIRWMT